MSEHKNFLRRALEAVVEGRSREAERYLARFHRAHEHEMKAGLIKR